MVKIQIFLNSSEDFNVLRNRIKNIIFLNFGDKVEWTIEQEKEREKEREEANEV